VLRTSKKDKRMPALFCLIKDFNIPMNSEKINKLNHEKKSNMLVMREHNRKINDDIGWIQIINFDIDNRNGSQNRQDL
jgi:hypothetical protein